ncbi:ROK family protein [Hippea alviniae]|uniref:ROK family protein n=1 Tax=Hippea alviniae TaxID=1279027 RepID=UPI000404043C|nr:ROK family protein [Hippea alviniae]
MRLAVDIGGSYLKYEALDSNLKGKVSVKEIEIIEFLKELIEKHRINKVAVSFAGQVKDSKIISAPNINLKNIDLKEELGVEVILKNDLYCAALSEAHFFNSNNLVALYSGTGLGCGVVLDGKPILSDALYGCEIGHIGYKKAPFRCGCLKDNCLELYASGSGIEKWAEFYNLDNSDLCYLYEIKHKIAEEYLEALAFAVGVVVAIFNPEIVVLGGGIVKRCGFVLNEVRKRAKRYAMPAAFNGLRIEKTQIENGSLEGAKLLLK